MVVELKEIKTCGIEIATKYNLMPIGKWQSFKNCLLGAAMAIIIPAAHASADTAEARCDIYPAKSDHVSDMVSCTFSQRQGYVTIRRADGVTHELVPDGKTVGNFNDQDGRIVYRQSGLADQGLIFRFPHESVFVYWNTAALNPDEADNLTSPFSTQDYDATTLLNCRDVKDREFGQCPAGILRMENREASIVVQNQKGERFTINFMTGYISATNHDVEAKLNEDIWTVTVNGVEIYEVPIAALEGG